MITRNFIEESRTLLSKRRDRPVTQEEAHSSIRNVVGFFELLARWKERVEINPLTADVVYVRYTAVVSDGPLYCEVKYDYLYWEESTSCFFQKFF